MTRTVALTWWRWKGIFLAFILSACNIALPLPAFAPTAEAQATIAAPTLTASEQPLPTETSPPADTPQPTATSAPATATTDTTATFTTVPTQPNETITATGTAVPAAPTETLHPRFYGTQPPNVPFGHLQLANKSKAEVYVSLQCTTDDEQLIILEYPVYGVIKVSAPIGYYVYVAWVGGRKFTGHFTLTRAGNIVIRFYKDKVIAN
jgi:hypothetical protein